MNKQYFEQNVTMAIEVEYEGGGRCWHTMKGSEVKGYLARLEQSDDRYLSDIDYCVRQEDPEVGKIIDAALKIWSDKEKRAGFNSFDKVIDSFLEETTEATKASEKPQKRVWTEDEIKSLIQTNDKVLYGALRKLYAEQTADEQREGATTHRSEVGFNGVDSKFLSSVAEFLKKTGFLTEKQKYITRKKMLKYVRQLTRLANA